MCRFQIGWYIRTSSSSESDSKLKDKEIAGIVAGGVITFVVGGTMLQLGPNPFKWRGVYKNANGNVGDYASFM